MKNFFGGLFLAGICAVCFFVYLGQDKETVTQVQIYDETPMEVVPSPEPVVETGTATMTERMSFPLKAPAKPAANASTKKVEVAKAGVPNDVTTSKKSSGPKMVVLHKGKEIPLEEYKSLVSGTSSGKQKEAKAKNAEALLLQDVVKSPVDKVTAAKVKTALKKGDIATANKALDETGMKFVGSKKGETPPNPFEGN